MKVYYRVKNLVGTTKKIPYNYNIYNALDGALQLGLECIPYFYVDEIIDKYQKGDIVLDGITQVNYCLNKFGIQPMDFNYPEVLQQYLGRKIWKDTIDSISNDEKKWSAGNFVKPIKEKIFTGKIISNLNDLIGCGSCYENYEVLVSEPLDIVYECRGFVYYDEIKDLRPYKGDYQYLKYIDTFKIVDAMDNWKSWKERPMSCSLDWGVIRKKVPITKENIEGYVYNTILIEGNLPYALGCYGYSSIDYIKLINAYIAQISNITDELHF